MTQGSLSKTAAIISATLVQKNKNQSNNTQQISTTIPDRPSRDSVRVLDEHLCQLVSDGTSSQFRGLLAQRRRIEHGSSNSNRIFLWCTRFVRTFFLLLFRVLFNRLDDRLGHFALVDSCETNHETLTFFSHFFSFFFFFVFSVLTD